VTHALATTIVAGQGKVLPSSIGFQSSFAAESWDALAHVGVLYRMNNTFTAGLSLRTPSLHLFDYASASSSEILGGATSDTRYWAGEGSFEASSPARISVGIGIEWDRLRLEINGFLYVGLDELAVVDMVREGVSIQPGITPARSLERIRLTESAAPVANIGVGSEFFLTRDLSVLTGFATDFTAIAPLSETKPYESRLFHDRANSVHTGFGVTSYTDYGDLLIGVRGSYLWGETSAVNTFVSPTLLEAVDFRGFSAVLVVAGRVSAGSVKEAAADVGDAVKGEAPQPNGKPPEPMREPVKKSEE
jgi:hypothetical protein